MATQDSTKPSLSNAEDSHATKGLLRLTMACNERCPFCNVPQEDYRPATPDESITDTELQHFIDRGDKTLTISGGEPTLLRKRLIQLVERANAGGISFIEVQTNAVLIDPAYAKELADAGVTSAFVSLLSHVPEHHDTLAGLEGAFPRCLAGIDALLDAGIRVTLNPVTARLTQQLVGDFVRFVGTRLPRVRSISMSAVQPHGRARDNLHLLPDYDVLSVHIRDARTVANEMGIELLNPYCGLPLCIGWEDGLSVSVEAIEATIQNTAQGLDNHGNKSHGPACMDCVLRSRCGGAWHAVWERRQGRGIKPPATVSMPWHEPTTSLELVAQAIEGHEPIDWKAVADSHAPTKWLWTDHVHPTHAIRAAGIGQVALRIPLHTPDTARPLLALARKLSRSNALVSPQRIIHIHLEWPIPENLSAQVIEDGIRIASAMGARSLTLTGPEAARFEARLHAKPRDLLCQVFPS